MTEITVSTLGDMQDKGYRFNVWCERCQRGGILPVAPFVEKLGRHHSMDVRGLLRCKECKQKDVEIRVQPPGPRIDSYDPGT